MYEWTKMSRCSDSYYMTTMGQLAALIGLAVRVPRAGVTRMDVPPRVDGASGRRCPAP